MSQFHTAPTNSERLSSFLHAAIAVPFGLLATTGIVLQALMMLG